MAFGEAVAGDREDVLEPEVSARHRDLPEPKQSATAPWLSGGGFWASLFDRGPSRQRNGPRVVGRFGTVMSVSGGHTIAAPLVARRSKARSRGREYQRPVPCHRSRDSHAWPIRERRLSGDWQRKRTGVGRLPAADNGPTDGPNGRPPRDRRVGIKTPTEAALGQELNGH